MIRWFVAANLTGRYGDAPLETLAKDSQSVSKSGNLEEVMKDLAILEGDVDYAKLFTDKFKAGSPQTLLLKMLLWDSAIDWKRGGKLSTMAGMASYCT